MKSALQRFALFIFAAGLGAAGPALSSDTASLPPVQKQGVVSYLSGGIGEEEADAFRRAAAAYPLEMLFARKTPPKDQFLADVRVAVRNRSGNALLETTAEGPFLLVNLPDGKYEIEAEYGGDRKHQSVEIRSGKHRRVVFVWPPGDESRHSVVSSAN